MLLKIALTAVVIGVVWMFFIRQARPRGVDRKPVKLPRIESLARCPECGVYRLYGSACDCDAPDRPDGG